MEDGDPFSKARNTVVDPEVRAYVYSLCNAVSAMDSMSKQMLTGETAWRN